MKSIDRKKIAYYIIFTSIIALLIVNAFYGYWTIDEPFHITKALRIFQGDGLFSDEWHVTLMDSFLSYPLICLYLLIKKSTDGIIIFCRLAYIIMSTIFSYVFYLLFKKYNFVGAAICSIFLLLFCPYCLQSLYYNSFCLVYIILSCALLVVNQTNNYLIDIISGVFYSFSVICCPFLSILFLIYFLYSIINKKEFSRFIFFALGVTIVFIIFMIFVLSRASLNQIFNNLPFIIDSSHKLPSFFVSIKEYIYNIVYLNSYNKYIVICIFILFLAIGLDKNRFNHKDLFLIIAIIISMVSMLCIFLYNNDSQFAKINLVFLPFVILGPICMLYNNVFVDRLLKYMWLPGVVYSFCLFLSSDRYYFAIASGFATASISSIIMIFILIKDGDIHIDFKKSIISLFVTSTLMCFAFEIDYRFYDRNKYFNNNSLLTFGPGEGLRVSESTYFEYCNYYNEIENINFKGESVLYLSKKTWLYLLKDGKYKIGSYSSYPHLVVDIWEPDWSILFDYYNVNPQNFPDNIYSEPEYKEIADKLVENKNYKCEIVSNGCYYYYAN